MKKKAAALFLAAVMGLSLTACGTQEVTAKVHSVLVDGVMPSQGDVVVNTSYIGKIVPKESVLVYPTVSGTVDKINYQVGSQVSAGDVLFEIDDTAAQNAISEAEKNYEDTKKEIDQAKSETKNKEDETRKEELSALADRRDAAKKLYDSLKKTEGVSKDDLSLAEEAYKNAQKDYESASKTTGSTTTSSTQETAYSQKLEEAQAQIDAAKAEADAYQVKTPINGVVESVNIVEGDLVSVRRATFVISNKDNMEVTFKVTEAGKNALNSGDKIQVEKDGMTYEASITEIGVTAEEESNLFEVRAALGAGSAFSTGMSVTVYADTQKASDVLKIPYDALYFQGDKTYVYCVREKKAVKTEVKVGMMNGEEAEILEGLTGEDIVISTWSPQLKHGASVELNYVIENGLERNTEEDDSKLEIPKTELSDGSYEESESAEEDDLTESAEGGTQWQIPSE